MKNLTKYALILLAGLSMNSCTDFLEENPTTSLSESSVYTTKAALEANVVGCYQVFHNSKLMKGTAQEFEWTNSALLIWKTGRKTDEWLDGLKFACYTTTNDDNNNPWTNLWPGINRCNKVLDKLPGSPVEESYKKEIEAEVKFIRAYLYSMAVRKWGDIPLLTHSCANASEAFAPKTAWYKVYAQIFDDLDFAEKNMRDRSRQESLNPEKNRPYKYAATALKTELYLYIGNLLNSPNDNFWDSSKDAELKAAGKDPRTPDFTKMGITSAADAYRLAYESAEKVINEGGYSLESDYRTLFRWTDHSDFFSNEGIFVLPGSGSSGSSYLTVRTVPQYPTGCKQATTKAKNSNSGRVRPSQFAVDNFLKYSGGVKCEDPSDVRNGLYISTTDPRFEASYFIDFESFTAVKNETNIKTYPDLMAWKYPTDVSFSFPYCKKYFEPLYNASSCNAGMYLIRLGGIYLMAAEAAAHLSGSTGDANWTNAVAKVNTLRERARKSHDAGVGDSACPPAWTASTYTTKDDLLEAIFWERFIECGFESNDSYCVHCNGATWLSNYAKKVNAFYNNPNLKAMRDYTFVTRIGESALYEENATELRKSLVSPIPTCETNANPNIGSPADFYWQ